MKVRMSDRAWSECICCNVSQVIDEMDCSKLTGEEAKRFIKQAVVCKIQDIIEIYKEGIDGND